MLPVWRFVPRTARLTSKYLYSGFQATPQVSVGQTGFTGWNPSMDISVFQGMSGDQCAPGVSEVRRVLSQGPSVQVTQENYSMSGLTSEDRVQAMNDLSQQDDHSRVLEGLSSHVSLYGCMQSNVPRPLNSSETSSPYASHLSMPGGGDRLLDKYLSGNNQYYHQSRHFTTSLRSSINLQGAQEYSYNEDTILTDPSPQGVQGDNCIQFKLWMENCQRYNLPNCEEQLQSLKVGRKTLAQVFMEQQEIIQQVADDFRSKQRNKKLLNNVSTQGVQDSSYSFEFSRHDPCPQGLQGEDCANYKMWANNCQELGNCEQSLQDVGSGRKTLQDIFNEHDELIGSVVKNVQQRRSYSTDSRSNEEVRNNKSQSSDSDSNPSPSNSAPPPNDSSNLSQKDKLKRAVKEYGGTVIVFHIGISLMSLGGFYLAVSSGLDVVGLLTRLGVGESILQSRIATGSTTFVMAYAVHKVFAPVRIAITLSCTPFIVRHLRKIGVLKPPKPKSS